MSFLTKDQALARSAALKVVHAAITVDFTAPSLSHHAKQKERKHRHGFFPSSTPKAEASTSGAEDSAQARSASSVTQTQPTQPSSPHASQQSETFLVTATYRLKTTHSTLTIDVDAQEILDVTIDGDATDYRIDGEHLVCRKVPVNESFRLTVSALMRFSRTGQGLHKYIDPHDGKTYIYSHFEPADAHRAWPCFDQPDIKPIWEFTVIAPADWMVVSNRAPMDVSAQPDAPNLRCWQFGTTEPLSSYLTALAAGHWHVVQQDTPYSGSSAGQRVSVTLRLLCRQSLAQYLDAEEIFRVTAQGLDFYHDRYHFAFPWGKYDQVFCPEYNIGAMENPGMVTFNDNFIIRDVPSPEQRQRLAATLLHEMCHMWFGDLVTMRWWNDLWLKESFADYESYVALGYIARYTDSWAQVALGRKNWAYEADSYSTTHPILADVPTVEAAAQNFDGISYAKGAAVLQQLSAWLTPEKYVRGLRRYFHHYAFSTADKDDFLDILAADKPEAMALWAHTWLETSGTTHMGVYETNRSLRIIQTNGSGGWNREDALVRGSSHTNRTETTVRPHAFSVAEWDTNSDSVRMHSVVMDKPSATCTLSSSDSLWIVNADDTTFAIAIVDDAQRTRLIKGLEHVKRPLHRAAIWQSLYQDVREGRLSSIAFIEAVMQLCQLEASGVVSRLMALIADAAKYCPVELRDEVYGQSADALLHEALNASSPHMRDAYSPAAFHFACLAPTSDERTRKTEDLMSMIKNVDLKWDGVYALVANQQWESEQAEIFRRRWDDHSRGYHQALGASYCAPQSWLRAYEALGEGAMTNEELRAMMKGIGWGRKTDIDAQAYCETLEQWWSDYPQHMAQLIVKGMMPSGYDSSSHAAALHDWLIGHEDANTQLRRVVTELYECEARHASGQLLQRNHGVI